MVPWSRCCAVLAVSISGLSWCVALNTSDQHLGSFGNHFLLVFCFNLETNNAGYCQWGGLARLRCSDKDAEGGETAALLQSRAQSIVSVNTSSFHDTRGAKDKNGNVAS